MRFEARRFVGMTDGDLPNSTAVQTLLCTLLQNPNACGMIHERQSIAHVQPSKSLAPQARRWPQSKCFTFRCLEKAT